MVLLEMNRNNVSPAAAYLRSFDPLDFSNPSIQTKYVLGEVIRGKDLA
jgi:hypothetical protein